MKFSGFEVYVYVEAERVGPEELLALVIIGFLGGVPGGFLGGGLGEFWVSSDCFVRVLRSRVSGFTFSGSGLTLISCEAVLGFRILCWFCVKHFWGFGLHVSIEAERVGPEELLALVVPDICISIYFQS